jgi:membrane protease YdiL (CAAX protease family)
LKDAVEFLRNNPGIERWLAAAFLCLTAATLCLLVYVRRSLRRGTFDFDRVPILAVPFPVLWAFFCLLTVTVLLFGGFFLPLASIVLVLGIFLFLGIDPRQFWGTGRISLFWLLVLGGGLTAALYLPLQGMALFSEWLCRAGGFPMEEQPAVTMFADAKGHGEIAFLLVYAVVAAPLSEEILFRGFLQPLLKGSLGRGAALGISAMVFAALHVHLPSFLPLCLLGLVLGAVYERSGSLPLCMSLHAWFNAVTASLLIAVKYLS